MWLADGQRLYRELAAELDEQAVLELDSELREFAMIGDQALKALA